MSEEAANLVPLGRITGAFGVRGWVRVASATVPPERILDYRPWWLGRSGSWHEAEPLEGRAEGTTVLARLAGVDDRDGALALRGTEIAVPRARLPALAEGDYYWADLIGLEVVNRSGLGLGRVRALMETGANDVLVVAGDRERLIPFVEDEVVLRVDLAAGRIEVDWEPDW